MPRLWGESPTVNIMADGQADRIYWGFQSRAYTHFFDASSFDVSELLSGLTVGVGRRVYFAAVNVEGDAVSDYSNEISKVFTLREEDLPDPAPPAPTLNDLSFDIPVNDDEPLKRYWIEVS